MNYSSIKPFNKNGLCMAASPNPVKKVAVRDALVGILTVLPPLLLSTNY